MKIVSIVGARPQFIKAAVVSREIKLRNAEAGTNIIEEVLVHTGQHYDPNMSAVFFREMDIPAPRYNLTVAGGSHGAMTGKMLEKIEEVLLAEKPDIVLVYGDTNSTLAGALAAVKLAIPVAHVEAGLRSFNNHMPEEINRILTDRISTALFCPTDTAVHNLTKEGLDPAQRDPNRQVVFKVGDVMYDAALYYKKIARPSPETVNLLYQLDGAFYLATIHRAENTDDLSRLEAIIKALDDISGNIPVVLPLHPRTRKLLQDYSLWPSKVKCIEPVSYFDMIELLSRCQAVFTDSGGVQKEAYFFGKYCITLRDETEWVELVENRVNLLVGASYKRIIEAERTIAGQTVSHEANLYGQGNAGKLIVDKLLEVFQ